MRSVLPGHCGMSSAHSASRLSEQAPSSTRNDVRSTLRAVAQQPARQSTRRRHVRRGAANLRAGLGRGVRRSAPEEGCHRAPPRPDDDAHRAAEPTPSEPALSSTRPPDPRCSSVSGAPGTWRPRPCRQTQPSRSAQGHAGTLGGGGVGGTWAPKMPACHRETLRHRGARFAPSSPTSRFALGGKF